MLLALELWFAMLTHKLKSAVTKLYGAFLSFALAQLRPSQFL